MLLARTLLTIVLISVTAALLWMDHALDTETGFMVIIFCAVVLSVREFYDLLIHRGYTPFAFWGTLCAGLMVAADWLGYLDYHPEMHWMGIVAFVFLGGLFVLQGWLRPREAGTVSMALTAFGLVYVWGLGHFIVRLRFYEPTRVGVWGVLLLVAVVKASDICAYLVGRGFGRHRPFARVSPKKSWEGYAAGLAAAVAASIACGGYLLGMSGWLAVVFAVPVCVFGNLGDLVESVIKRDLDAKDSGVRFPGLGGVLDVIDSLLLAGPVAFYLLKQMVIAGYLK